MPKRIQVIGVLISGRNRQNTCPQDIRQAVRHPCRITPVRDQRGQPPGDPHPLLRPGQKQHPGIRRDRTTIKSARDFF